MFLVGFKKAGDCKKTLVKDSVQPQTIICVKYLSFAIVHSICVFLS